MVPIFLINQGNCICHGSVKLLPGLTPSKAPEDSCMDGGNALVNIGIVYFWDKMLVSSFTEIFLDFPDVSNIIYILVFSRI